jgi:hypothetical protein
MFFSISAKTRNFVGVFSRSQSKISTIIATIQILNSNVSQATFEKVFIFLNCERKLRKLYRFNPTPRSSQSRAHWAYMYSFTLHAPHSAARLRYLNLPILIPSFYTFFQTGTDTRTSSKSRKCTKIHNDTVSLTIPTPNGRVHCSLYSRVQWFWHFFTFWGITTHPWHPKGPRIWKLAKKIF